MNMPLPVRRALLTNFTVKGMDRFFSTMNLARYRRLAGREMAAAERNGVLQLLADEWDEFTRECRVAMVMQMTSSPEKIPCRSKD